jgi:hypothetical protein
MKVEFDKAHLVAYGKEFENDNQHDCAFRRWDDVDNPLNLSQLQICLTGSPEFILQKLQKIVSEMQHNADENLNKPKEGSIVTRDFYVADIIVPVWEGEISDEFDIKELEQYKLVDDDE